MRKVIIIDNDRIGIFDLCRMEIDSSSKAEAKSNYDLDVKLNTVIESKSLVRKIIKNIIRRIRFERRHK